MLAVYHGEDDLNRRAETAETIDRKHLMGALQLACQPLYFSHSLRRNSARLILPLGVLGRVATNSILRGYL